MTERRAGAVTRDASQITIGPSAMSWDGSSLTIRIRERGLRRIRGVVRVHPQALETRRLTLDDAGLHRWQPLAPCARVEVALQEPDLRWNGAAYFDTNDGDRPLEADFRQWDWCRAPLPDGSAVLYEVQRRQGAPLRLAMRYQATGGVADIPPGERTELPATLWRVPRGISAATPRVTETLEDTPFYARSVIEASLLGQRVTGMHESLSLDRFAAPWVQAMLPFRMPRI
jgi:carotenoid 1,2-hydratase